MYTKHYIEDNTPEQLTVWLSTMEYARPSHMCKVSKDTCISITLNHDQYGTSSDIQGIPGYLV